eukprot:XP_020406573.1 uncharacterized protein LOC109945168 [Zea mays]
MWESVLHVLAIVHEDGRVPTQAAGLIEKMESFKFAFILKLMLKVLAITNELSQMLQRKSVDIVLAMELLDVVKARMAMMRTDNGWESFFEDVKEFCANKGIPVVDMDAEVPIRDIATLSIKMVLTGKHVVFPLVYKLIELALLLLVSTSSVERTFSAMNIIKRELCNNIEDDWLNDLMVCYTEKEIFKSIDDELIIRRFQRLKTRRMQLPRSQELNAFLNLNLHLPLALCRLGMSWMDHH